MQCAAIRLGSVLRIPCLALCAVCTRVHTFVESSVIAKGQISDGDLKLADQYLMMFHLAVHFKESR